MTAVYRERGVTMLKAGGTCEKKKQVLPKLELADFPKENQAELDEKLIPLVPFSQIHFRTPFFGKNKTAELQKTK